MGPRERQGRCLARIRNSFTALCEPKGVGMRLTAFRNQVGEVSYEGYYFEGVIQQTLHSAHNNDSKLSRNHVVYN